MPVTVGDKARLSRGASILFVTTIFTGSFLLFLVQPMIARLALPRLGGAPAVWNSAMLVYQSLLLAGYAYAHWLGRFPMRRQSAVHLGAFLVAALTLPIGLIAATPSADANPFVWVPWLLVMSIGPLFFVISAQAPLVQRWFAAAGAGDPYPLYAASNLGSFAGLLSYPLILEPLLPLATQRWLWSAGFALLAILVFCCRRLLPAGPNPAATVEAVQGLPPSRRTVGKWILLSAVPSGLILSTTLHITTDLVAMPLLWVLPLSAYLLSFTFAFAANRRAARIIGGLAPFVLLVAAAGAFVEGGSLALLAGGVAVISLFCLSVALHSQLFDLRPIADQLTSFYLAMSFGGVLGGLFCALVAPLLFDWTYEHLLLILAAAFLLNAPNPFARLFSWWRDESVLFRLAAAALIALVLILIIARPWVEPLSARNVTTYTSLALIALGIVSIGNRPLFTATIFGLLAVGGAWEVVVRSSQPGAMTRSFFGVYTVRTEPNQRLLVHGTTLHGTQNLGSPEKQRQATTYYGPRSGVGLAMRAAPALFGNGARIGVVGLGAGTLACYARPGQSWTFYEIDPLVVQIASDPKRFNFLSTCVPQARIEVGDARLLIERKAARQADLLVIDAFSSDSIPIHLLTREAFAGYRRHLRADGLLAVHISNRYLDLDPVIAAAARDGGWVALRRTFMPTLHQRDAGETGSFWIILSPSKQTLDRFVALSGEEFEDVETKPGFAGWTDEFASLLPVIRSFR